MFRFFAALLALLPLAVSAHAQTTLSYEEQVQKMYVAYYGRPGDDGGISYWAGELAENDGNLNAIIEAFGNSAEFQERFGDFDNEALVDNIFQQLLGRSADPEGLAFYVGNLDDGTMSLATIALNIADGAQPESDDYQLIANKLAIAGEFTNALVVANLGYSLDEIVYARQILDAVSSIESSLEAARDLIETTLPLFPDLPNTQVLFSTTAGDITIELFNSEAPVTVNNILYYVDNDLYDGTIFHRVIEGFVVQGGGYNRAIGWIPTEPPIVNEASNGLSNVRGTLAMARTDNPDSATSQFFINLVDNDFLDPGENTVAGYAVFGRVIDGMDVVDAMASTPTASNDVPLTDIVLTSATRAQ